LAVDDVSAGFDCQYVPRLLYQEQGEFDDFAKPGFEAKAQLRL